MGVAGRQSVQSTSRGGTVPSELKFYYCFDLPNDGLLIQLQMKHLYNGLKLGKDEVESIAIWQNEGGWDKALHGAKPWLLS